MNNKTAFTLAEVLVTLTIVGIISALVIPVLFQNLQDYQLKTSWKQAYSDINKATALIKKDGGGSLIGSFTSTIVMKDKYANYLSVVKNCNNASSNGCWHKTDEWQAWDGTLRTGTGDAGLMLNNGTIMFFTWTSASCSNNASLKICGDIYLDVNGFKKPNIIGKDIFAVSITEKPNQMTVFLPVATCGETGSLSGLGCGREYLKQ